MLKPAIQKTISEITKLNRLLYALQAHKHDLPNTSRKMQWSNHTSPSDLRARVDVLLVKFLLLHPPTRTRLVSRPQPGQRELLVLLYGLLMRVLLLHQLLGRHHLRHLRRRHNRSRYKKTTITIDLG